MPVLVRCACGAQIQASDNVQGKSANCPKCGQPIAIPHGQSAVNPAGTTNATQSRIPVKCSCGQAFRAKPSLAGKQVTCPACHHPLQVPFSSASGSPAGMANQTMSQPDDEPFGLNSIPTAPMGAGVPVQNTLGAPQQMPASGFTFRPVGGTTSPPSSSYTPQRNQKRRRRSSTEFNSDPFTIGVAIFCILHGFGRTASLYGIAFLFSSGYMFSFLGIVSMLTAAASIGIGVAGIGLLTNQYWAKQVGGIAAMGYLLLMVASLVIAFIGSAPYISGLGMRLSFYWIPRMLFEAITPALLLYRLSRDD